MYDKQLASFALKVWKHWYEVVDSCESYVAISKTSLVWQNLSVPVYNENYAHLKSTEEGVLPQHAQWNGL